MHNFPDLDETTRLQMISELELDCQKGLFYEPVSMRKAFIPSYRKLLAQAFAKGSVESLSRSLPSEFFLQKYGNGRKVPSNVRELIAFTDFNRYYARALLARALDEGKNLTIHRAKPTTNERKESDNLIGRCYFDKKQMQQMLAILRDYRVLFAKNNPVEFMRPNSGLSLRLSRSS